MIGVVGCCVVAGLAVDPPWSPAGQAVTVTSGRVRLIEEAMIPAAAAGVVAEILVAEGDRVTAGQPLVKLRDVHAKLDEKSKRLAAENRAGVEAAEAKVKAAKVKLDVEEVLDRRRANARIEVLDKQTQVEVAQAEAKNEAARTEQAAAEHEKASATLADMTIKSPISGVVSQRLKRVGEAVQQYEPIVHVLRTDRVRVEAGIDLTLADRVRAGAVVEVRPVVRWAPLATLPHLSGVTAVKVLADGRRLAAAADDGSLTVWNLERMTRSRVVHAPGGRPLRALALVPGRVDEVAAGGDDGYVRIWNVTTGKEIAVLHKPERADDPNLAVHALAIREQSPTLVALGLRNGRVVVTGVDSEDAPLVFSDHLARVTWVEIREDVVFSAADDATARVRPLAGGGAPATFGGRMGPAGRPVHQLDWTRDGREFLFASNTLMQVRRYPDGLAISEWRAPARSFAGVAAFVPGAPWVVAANEDSGLQLWERPEDRRPARLARSYEGHAPGSAVAALDVARTGGFFATGGADRTVRVWRLPDATTLTAERLRGRIAYVAAQAERGGDKRLFYVEVDNREGWLLPNGGAEVVLGADP
jgi:multidrug efflux pump subunit AcrA (membrane-fusion protein)